MTTQRPLVARGERAADFVARRGDGQATRFYGYVGGAPAVLIFSGAGGQARAAELAGAVRTAVGDDVDVHAIATGDDTTDPDTFRDPEGLVHGAYGVPPDGDPMIVVLDPNVRVAVTRPATDDAAVADVAVAVAAAAHADDGVTVQGGAPVLFVPDTLDAALCAGLIDRWEQSGNVETGVEATIGDGRAEQTDAVRKRRRDHIVQDPQLLRTLTSHIGRRVMPEIRKAFVSSANRFEGFKIGCYDATDAGFFTRHRDNLSQATAHRRFGLTINLNDNYDGGELRFPEYGPDRYRPAAGEALVFSGSHLHEVLPVTRGRRFVLLSFLFQQAADGG
jgi:predicted 2-oxoglutarate/Fe(II)-dependent dioxygenase YbiX